MDAPLFLDFRINSKFVTFTKAGFDVPLNHVPAKDPSLHVSFDSDYQPKEGPKGNNVDQFILNTSSNKVECALNNLNQAGPKEVNNSKPACQIQDGHKRPPSPQRPIHCNFVQEGGLVGKIGDKASGSLEGPGSQMNISEHNGVEGVNAPVKSTPLRHDDALLI